MCQLRPGDGRFGNRDDEGNGGGAGGGGARQRRQPDRFAAEGRVRIAAFLLAEAGDDRQRLVTGDEAFGAVDAVEDAVLRRRGQHFQRDIGNVDLERAVFGHDDALGNRQRGARQHAVGDGVRRVDRLPIGVDQRDQTDRDERHEQPQEQPASKRIGSGPRHQGLGSLSR